MKKLAGAAALVAGAIMVSQSAHAQYAGSFIQNDLYLGFQNQGGGGSADYIINLGSASSLINSINPVNLSGDFSLSDFTSSLLQGNNAGATIKAGVIGGSSSDNPSDVFVTQLRSTLNGQSQGGSIAPAGLSDFQDDDVVADMSQIIAPSVGTGVLDTGKSWESFVEPTFSAGTVYGDSGVNPDSLVSTSSVLYEDLWETSTTGSAQPFVYEGYFTLDLTGDGGSTLTFTPVPEPSTLAISGAGGILGLLLRNRLWRRKA